MSNSKPMDAPTRQGQGTGSSPNRDPQYGTRGGAVPPNPVRQDQQDRKEERADPTVDKGDADRRVKK